MRRGKSTRPLCRYPGGRAADKAQSDLAGMDFTQIVSRTASGLLAPLCRTKFALATTDQPPLIAEGAIHCRQRLGGLLKHYYRQAA
jgi:hypothetical protein